MFDNGSKLIGAQAFDLSNIVPPNETTPLDMDGHGTHTASTAAGISVKRASLYGIAEGTARGGVPSARLAIYKVCWNAGCEDMDILAAYDAAIADGVDIISVSLGGITLNYLDDSIGIGAFHASEKGILTVCAGGNSGPYLWTVQNVAPWVFTVAASSIDRKFVTDVKLGNGEKFSVCCYIFSFLSFARILTPLMLFFLMFLDRGLRLIHFLRKKFCTL